MKPNRYFQSPYAVVQCKKEISWHVCPWRIRLDSIVYGFDTKYWSLLTSVLTSEHSLLTLNSFFFAINTVTVLKAFDTGFQISPCNRRFFFHWKSKLLHSPADYSLLRAAQIMLKCTKSFKHPSPRSFPSHKNRSSWRLQNRARLATGCQRRAQSAKPEHWTVRRNI